MPRLMENCRKKSLDLGDVILGRELLQAEVGQLLFLLRRRRAPLLYCCGGILLSQLGHLCQLLAERVRRFVGSGGFLAVLACPWV